MNLSPEFYMSVAIQLVSIGVFFGVYKTTINFMQQQIIELKEDMRKYNDVLTRLAVAENSISSAHHRIDELSKDNNG